MVVDEQDRATSTLNLTNVIISDPNGHAVKVEVTNATIEIIKDKEVFSETSSWGIILAALASWI
jgi:hypothetical protein